MPAVIRNNRNNRSQEMQVISVTDYQNLRRGTATAGYAKWYIISEKQLNTPASYWRRLSVSAA
jgi:hypothetical protein